MGVQRAIPVIDYDFINLMLTTLGALLAVMFAMMYWHRQRRRDEFELEKWRTECKLRERELAREQKQEIGGQDSGRSAVVADNTIRVDTQPTDPTNPYGGFAFIDVPDERKSLFHDMMKGFEEFAKLKGYRVSIAIDTTPPGKVGLRFTILEQGVTVATETVRSHVDEYIAEFNEDAPFENMPIVVDPIEHERLKAVLSSRFIMVKNSAEMHKTKADLYRKFAEELSQLKMGGVNYLPAFPTIIHNQLEQVGSHMNKKSISVDRSPGAAVGRENVASIVGSEINIGSTHAEQGARIHGLKALIELVKNSDLEQKEDVARHLMNAKEELEDGNLPDPGLISRFLGRANNFLALAEKGTEIFNKTKEVMGLFGHNG